MRPLILSTAIGYEPAKVKTFLGSLRRTSYTGAIAIVVDRENSTLCDYLAQHDVEVIPVELPPRWMPKRLAESRFNHGRIRFLHEAVAQASRFIPLRWRPAYATAAAAPFHHPATYRHFFCWRYVQNNSQRFSHVLAADIRDVVFQADPFCNLPDRCLWLFQENRALSIADDYPNTCWIETAYGQPGLLQVGQRGILCSGIILASTDLYLRMSEVYNNEIIRLTPRISGMFGPDQAILAHLYWTGRFPDAELKQNFESPVANLHLEPAERFRFDDADRLLNNDGKPIAVLHQFDRHAILDERIARQMSDPVTPL